MLIIEHDMPLRDVDQRPASTASRPAPCISTGPAEQVRSDPLVIASYLGTDVAAIERSGARTAAPQA